MTRYASETTVPVGTTRLVAPVVSPINPKAAHIWCDQCERLAAPAEIAACDSPFCKPKKAVA